MAVEQVYVRFKGRVLGPLTREKTHEMIKRGQITRQHELCFDRNSWRPAHEFEEFFPRHGNASKGDSISGKKDGDQKLRGPADVEWFANFDGSNQGPTNEVELRQCIAQGKVTRSTLVWREGMAKWKEAGSVIPDWFPDSGTIAKVISRSFNSSRSIPSADEGVSEFATIPIRTFRWVLFLGILGVTLSILGLIGNCVLFVREASSAGAGPPKALAVIIRIGAIVASTMIVYISTLLIGYGNKISVLRYRPFPEEIASALRALNRFWLVLAIFSLVTLILVSLTTAVMNFYDISIDASMK